MDSMLFIIAIFVSIFIAFGMVVTATTIRQLREEVTKCEKQNWKLEKDYYDLKDQFRDTVAKLKEENHRLSCSEHSLLSQRQNLRNEIKRLVLDRYYWGNLKQWMHDEVIKSIHSPEFHKMEGVNRVERLEEETFRKHYKW